MEGSSACLFSLYPLVCPKQSRFKIIFLIGACGFILLFDFCCKVKSLIHAKVNIYCEGVVQCFCYYFYSGVCNR